MVITETTDTMIGDEMMEDITAGIHPETHPEIHPEIHPGIHPEILLETIKEEATEIITEIDMAGVIDTTRMIGRKGDESV